MRRGPLIVAALSVVAAAVVVAGPGLQALRAYRASSAARDDLELLLAQQRRFASRLDEYLTVGPAGATIGGPAATWVDEPCPAACRRLAIEACSSFGCLEFEPSSPLHRYGCRAQRSGDAYDVTCAAAGDLDGDGAVSLLVVGTSTSGTLHAPLPALDPRVVPGRCAAIEAVPAGVVYDCTPGVR